jgi:ectoine hydroxylase-related dioxygenase (phytanoyl-CoA dioxygenase family)
MALSQAQLSSYADQGYLVVENILAPDVLARVRDIISEITDAAQAGRAARAASIAAEPDAAGAGGGGVAVAAAPLRKLNGLVPHDAFCHSVAANPALLDIVAQLTGNPRQIMLYSDQVFMKPAHCGSPKPLHQDNSYFRVTPHDYGVTCWVAIDDATEENGCMRYIPGSHKLGLLPHKQLTAAHLTPEASDLGRPIPVPIPAGAAIFHHLLTLHSSEANRSAYSRRAWALHYANRDADSPMRSWDEMVVMR